MGIAIARAVHCAELLPKAMGGSPESPICMCLVALSRVLIIKV